jgi:uncharacterized damage-inducible protein DinB
VISFIVDIVPGFAAEGEGSCAGAYSMLRSEKSQRQGCSMADEHFATLACYNAWANRRLYQACESLSEREYLCERPASGGSLHAVLNHLLVVDRIWLARIEGRNAPGLRLDQILYADLIGLKVARSAEDARLCHLVAGISATMLAQPVTYRDARGNRHRIPVALMFAHLFNHQAEHRGQMRALLWQTGVTLPSLDLVRFVEEEGAAAAG